MKGRRQAAVPIGILQLRTTAASRSGLGAGDVFGLDRVVNATQPPRRDQAGSMRWLCVPFTGAYGMRSPAATPGVMGE
jgi:hypothetical protein